ncbi:MAG: hypothetical protein ACI89X_001188 [Planctomycetota bacterium]|jgi:hypothetical protein
MSWRRPRLSWVVAIALLAVYCSTYAMLRTQRTMVRTGTLYNVRDSATRKLAPEGGWMHSGVRGDDRVPGVQLLEIAYWPLIQAESLFWDTAGRQLRTETPP